MEHGAGAPAPAEPEQPTGAPGSRRSNAVALAATVAVLVGGVGGYLLGAAGGEPVPPDAAAAERRGFLLGQEAVTQQFAPGTPQYRRIYDTGVAAGFRRGRRIGVNVGKREAERRGPEDGRQLTLEPGRAIGRLQGEPVDVSAGARAALGFGAWQAGAFYVVRVQAGSRGVPYRVAARQLIGPQSRYAVCAQERGRVCAEQIPPAG